LAFTASLYIKERTVEHKPPGFPGKCYGSSTISERGQIVIPAEARREMGLEPGTRLLIFGPEGRPVLTLMTADMVAKFVRHAMERLAEFEQLIEEVPADRGEIE
jgi:AbrB family looped-hinge helix DNA binding protein